MDQTPHLALRDYINRFVQLQEQEWQALIDRLEPRSARKKEVLTKHGEVARTMFFLVKGFVRFFHIKEDGTEVTSDFFFAPGFITSYTSFVEQKPSVVNIQCLQRTDILVLEYKDLMKLYERFPSIERLGRLISEQVFITTEKHLLSFLNDPPLERYKWLLKEYPEYIRYIPLQYLASYLGITPETLSRIRNRILL